MKNLLRSSILFVDRDGPHQEAGRAGRLRRAAAVALTLLVGYGVASRFSLFYQNPFRVSVDKAVELGGWEADCVHFHQGHYGYRYLFSEVEAELLVDGPEGRRPVRIELRNDPFTGWSVRSFQGRPVEAAVRLTSGP